MARSTEQPDIESVRPGGLAVRFPVLSDYETVKPSRAGSAKKASAPRHSPQPDSKAESKAKPETAQRSPAAKQIVAGPTTPAAFAKPTPAESAFKLKRGHSLAYAGIFLFTIVLYARPAEFYPSPVTASLALIIALCTLGVFLPMQISLEGTLTARPSEVNFVLLFCVTAALSIPLAINPPIAWQEFSGTFIRCIIIFIVIINVTRTKARLEGLLLLALGAGLWLSIEAINQFRLGTMLVEGYRASGRGTGIFGNTNDMALHVVTVFPIAVALLFRSKSIAVKFLYGTCSAVLLGGIFLSYSRGAFLSLIVVTLFLGMKFASRHRLGFVIAVVLIGGAALFFAPDQYGGRLLSIFDSKLDPGGSSDARRGELIRSIVVAIRHPLLGIGIGNYQPEMSHRGLVTHNSYTQVAAEVGAAALICYTLFIVTPLRRLGQIARETFAIRASSNYYYLSVGLQASLVSFMVSSFFLSVPYVWYVYYLVAFAVCLRRLYEAETGRAVVVATRKERREKKREERQGLVAVASGAAVKA